MNIDGVDGDSVNELKDLRITQLDEDEEQEEQEGIVMEEEDFEEDDDEGKEEPVNLGFLEKPKNRWSLLRQVFPAKAGGVPAWLDPVNLPSGRSCLCDICGEPLQFVLQVYAPIEDKESTFHRTLFLFMCTSMACLLRDQHEQWKRAPEKASRSVKVFRCQIPLVNIFYTKQAPAYDGTDQPLGSGAALCGWCGTWKGDKVCASCKKVRYCSQKHQVLHWRSGHKADCQRLSLSVESSNARNCDNGPISSVLPKEACKTLWPEYELINVAESDYGTEMSEDNGNANSLISRSRADEKMKSLMNDFEGDPDRRSWASFQERISKAPEQVLRYCRSPHAKPLWPMLSGRPSKADIPGCSYCSGPMCFEFQVLPQLLYYFGVKNDANSLDWATIAVYACEASCESNPMYKEEFPWVQLNG